MSGDEAEALEDIRKLLEMVGVHLAGEQPSASLLAYHAARQGSLLSTAIGLLAGLAVEQAEQTGTQSSAVLRRWLDDLGA